MKTIKKFKAWAIIEDDEVFRPNRMGKYYIYEDFEEAVSSQEVNFISYERESKIIEVLISPVIYKKNENN